jgi:hypothetical protein
VVFIESRWFTRRLQALARGAADDVLREIQNDLLSDPERGRLVPGLGGIRKARSANPGRGKGKRRISILLPVSRIPVAIFTFWCYSTRTSRRIYRLRNEPFCAT